YLPLSSFPTRRSSDLPGERTALLAGGVRDEEVPAGARAAARYAHIRGLMSQDTTHRFGEWNFAQTSNAACRREAFEAVGGFRERSEEHTSELQSRVEI